MLAIILSCLSVRIFSFLFSETKPAVRQWVISTT